MKGPPMDEIEFAILTQGQKIADAAEALRKQEVAIKKSARAQASSLADEAQALAGQLDRLAQDIFELASRWH